MEKALVLCRQTLAYRGDKEVVARNVALNAY